MNPHLNAFNESRFLMILVEGTDGVDDLINLLHRLPVHESVEFIEVGFDGCVNEATGFVIGIEQHHQDALALSV